MIWRPTAISCAGLVMSMASYPSLLLAGLKVSKPFVTLLVYKLREWLSTQYEDGISLRETCYACWLSHVDSPSAVWFKWFEVKLFDQLVLYKIFFDVCSQTTWPSLNGLLDAQLWMVALRNHRHVCPLAKMATVNILHACLRRIALREITFSTLTCY